MTNRLKTLYLKGLDNLIVISQSENFNRYMLTETGIVNKNFLQILMILSPFIYLLIVIFTLLYFILAFIFCVFRSFIIEKQKIANDSELFLFFTELLYDRSKSAQLFETSKYWVIGPNIKKSHFDLSGKEIIDYKRLISTFDYFKVLYYSLATLVSYMAKYRCLYPIFKCWSFYEVLVAIKKHTSESTFVFANQSDRWAILFDAIPSKRKILIQHGLSPSFEIPHMLNHIDEFYSISNKTWEDAYKYLMNCKPKLKLMKPTIKITDLCNKSFKVLLVTHVLYFDIEKQAIINLQDKEVELYVKKHPTLINDGCYKFLLHDYRFNYIENAVFPKVNLVISYDSTLAYEYMVYNIPVYFYNSDRTKIISDIDDLIIKLKH